MASRPNIVFMLIDDLGWKDVGCYGSEFYETPNIDRLARSGLHFTDAYASCPVCSPTRASILTGKYPARIGVTNFISWLPGRHPNKGKLVDAPYIDHLPESEYNIAKALRDSGYSTWHVGKWHLGGGRYRPEQQGFDINIGGCEWGMPVNGYFSPWGIPGFADGPEGEYLTDRMGDEAAKLIRRHAAGQRSEDSNARSKPFYLNLAFYSVHTPIQAKPEIIAKYEAKRALRGLDKRDELREGCYYPGDHLKHKRIVRRMIQSDPVYAAMIESLDNNIGKVLDAIDESGITEDTIIFFTSDNGGEASAYPSPTCNAPLSEGKGWMYEGGTREPFIVRWPGVTRPGKISTLPITSPDIYPTILDISGIAPIPEQHVDGVSFAMHLRASDDPESEARRRERPLFWHYPHYGNQGGTPGASVRKGDWKLIRFFEDGHEELFNLREDLSETTNLVDAEPEKRAELSRLLTEWAEEIEAIEPEVNPDYEPWPEREPCGHFAAEASQDGEAGSGGGSEMGPSDPRV